MSFRTATSSDHALSRGLVHVTVPDERKKNIARSKVISSKVSQRTAGKEVVYNLAYDRLAECMSACEEDGVEHVRGTRPHKWRESG